MPKERLDLGSIRTEKKNKRNFAESTSFFYLEWQKNKVIAVQDGTPVIVSPSLPADELQWSA